MDRQQELNSLTKIDDSFQKIVIVGTSSHVDLSFMSKFLRNRIDMLLLLLSIKKSRFDVAFVFFGVESFCRNQNVLFLSFLARASV